ncbi:apolipoprotein B-100 [Chanos chanos]|uniref:Apolipoprotein B-100 n=1 Tax=Chanos chanos TaxID=29144 RepID=A0A6J2V4B9_CHACN|nr:apolipoprotein B-100-like [Chanos chanos]
MGDIKLCILLLLITYTFAQQEAGDAEEHSPTCILAKRYKNFRRYEYQYEAETQNGVMGASNLRNGPRVTCKVEIEVPQTCSFVLRTSECSLSEVVDVDAEGMPIYGPATDAQAFQTAMEKNTLKVTVEGETDVKLFPEEDESINILNIKRGIISALVVPAIEEDKNKKMATIHGICKTELEVNDREDIATNITITRDLSGCDSFNPQRDYTSPLAIISGMQYPLSKLIGSTQTCNYQFDNQKKHMTSGTCTEKHILLPFSYQNEHGISSLVKQTLTLQGINKINDRVFEYNESNLKHLPMEAVEDKAAVQTSEAVLATFRELKALSETQQGHQRASMFQKLVGEIRGLQLEALSQATKVMDEDDHLLTWQALTQCGTPECTSAMLQILRSFDPDAMEVDVAVYALGIMHTPSRLLVKDLLEMAKYKQSKAMMYSLSNVVRRLYQAEGKVTPEIASVNEFIASILGADCAGEKEQTFLTLRVLGNMGEAMEAADPNIKSILLKCMRQPATTLSVQMAAIQAFRRISVTDEVRSNLQRVAQYPKGAVQKRLAAYLILMRSPEASDLELVKKILTQEQNAQVKAFVASHVYNIIHSKDPETQELGKTINEVMQENEVTTHSDYTESSRNYKMDASMGGMSTGMQGNIIFDPSSLLPREVMLETTLKAFGYNLDMWELGLEGRGFEPTIESLFGKNGFFPDTISKAMYWVGDKMPNKMNEVLQNWVEPLRTEKTKRQVPENIVREIVRNFNKLAKDLRSQESPEAMAYFRIMGHELGYIKNSELTSMANKFAMYAEILSKNIPTEIMKTLMSADKNIFAHYIFMDNDFSLPTASGFPLKFALSGTFAPGIKGGLHMEPRMREVNFKPSIGVEFVTRMGVHIPKFIDTAVEMHTNMYHESTLNAKISMGDGQFKLTIPAPQDTTQLLRVSNRMLMVTSGQATLVPPMAEGRINSVKCNPLFSGVKYCTTARYSLPGAGADAPYFPLAGETKFALDIQPTGEVTEYTATFAYELLNEGKEGRQKSDLLKMVLRAEGPEPAEAVTTIKFNRNRNVLTTSVEIPDYDVEAGIRVGLADSSAKGKKLTIDITNKNIVQLSLIGRAKLEAMRDGQLQVQLIVPSLKTDASITAIMTRDEELTLGIESNIKLPETSSVQKVAIKYADDKVEVLMKSDVDSEIQKLIPNTEGLQAWLQQLFEDILDQRVVKTDMKLRHIYSKSVEAGQIWLDRISADVPYIETLKNNMPELHVPSLPEKLYLNIENEFRYKFNKDRITITMPLPLGGKTSEDLRIPLTMDTPHLVMPQLGLMLPSKQVHLPTFTIPSNYDFTLPLLGMVEVSAKMNSNFYNMEVSISGGNNTEENPSYVATYKVLANSPVEILSYTAEGKAQITDMPEETLKVSISSSLLHKLVDARFSIEESAIITDEVKGKGSYKMEAFSPLGMQMSLVYTTQVSISSDITGDGNMDGSLKVGDLTASTSLTQSFNLLPSDREARAESSFRFSSPLLQISNKVKASTANGELEFESNTNINNDPVKHTTKINIEFKEAQFTIKSDSVTKAEERMLRHQVDLSATMEKASIRIESQVDDNTNRGYSLLAGSLSPQGLEINSDASINFDANRGAHKGTLSLNKDGLTTSCTSTVQASILTFENVFHGSVATSGASMSVTTKGTIRENSAELKIDGRVASTEVYFNSVLKGDLFNSNTRNRVTFKLNEDGLNLSNNLIASLQEMKTENTHSLTITFDSLAFRSESDSFISDRNAYKHNVAIEIQGFTASVNANNDLKILGVSFINDAQIKAEPHKVGLTGVIKGAYAEEELRHSYEVIYADLALNAKCSTSGKVLGTQMTQSSEMDYKWLELMLSNQARLNSPSLRLESTVQTKVEPFSFDIDASFNSDGELNLYGRHNGQVNSKFLFNRKFLSFSLKHECKASTSHQLDNGNSLETNFQNEIASAFEPNAQSLSIKTESKLNNHAFDQAFEFSNSQEGIAMGMKGTVLTSLLNKESDDSQEFAISGSLKYEYNSDFYILDLPIMEKLRELSEEIKVALLNMKDKCTEYLQDIDARYEITTTLKDKASELKEVIRSFDVNLFIQDVKNFVSSIEVEKYLGQLTNAIPTEEITRVLKSIRDMIIDWIKRNDIINKYNMIYTKVEEVMAQYEIEEMVEKIMDNAVELMKQFQIKETIQSAINVVRSIDITPVLEKLLARLNELLELLKTFEFTQMIDDLTDVFSTMLQRIRSIDLETATDSAVEIIFLPITILKNCRFPLFGKLYGEFEIKSPDHALKTIAELKNSTDSSETPQFTAILNSQLKSTFDLIAYAVDATAHLSVPQISQLSFTETVKFNHMALSLDHQGSLGLHGASAQVSSKTTANANTDPYKAELVNSAFFTLENGFSGTLETSYNHNVNMPVANIFSETKMSQKAIAQLQAGTFTLTIGTEGNGKCAISEYSDVGTHKSDMEIVMNVDTLKLTFTGATDSSLLKMKQSVNVEGSAFSHISIDANAETETPYMKNGVASVRGQIQVQDLKIQLNAAHNAELIGPVEGTISNSLDLKIVPFEIIFDTKNKENTKLSLPFKLSGKVDLQNDIAFTLNPTVQKASWTGLARFNQNKYSHYLTMDNGEKEININILVNGEANLDALNTAYTIPEMTVPFFDVVIPSMEDISLWENTGLSKVLITPQQTFDMNAKLRYVKSTEMFVVDINMEPIFDAINENVQILHENLILGKDKAVEIISASYDQAMTEYEKLNTEVPKTITIPGYKLPVINIEVSSFTIPLPDLSLITMPGLRVPVVLKQMTFPRFTLPKMPREIMIPVMGDLTSEFSLKTAIFTINSNAGILNHEDIVARFEVRTSSEFDLLVCKIVGSSTLHKHSEAKLTSSLSLEHKNIEGNHESTVSLNGISAANIAKVDLAAVKLEVYQELLGNAEEGLVISVSSPSAGLLGLQLQSESLSHLRGRLYNRYPSEPKNDVDIMSVDIALMDNEKLNIKAQWNLEAPSEMLLELKEKIPDITSTLNLRELMSDDFYAQIKWVHVELQDIIDRIKILGESMYRKTIEKIAAVDITKITNLTSDSIMYILREYEKNIQALLDAAIKFLRETQFQIPGHPEKLTGFEVYEKISAFVADVIEEAITRVPEMIASKSEGFIEYIRDVEVTIPGTNFPIRGTEILDDLFSALQKIQTQLITIVKNLGEISLESIAQKMSEILKFSIEKVDELLVTLASQDIAKLSTWVSHVYTDAINSDILKEMVDQVQEFRKIVEQYWNNDVKPKLDEIFADLTLQQLNADIQSWIDSVVKRIEAFNNQVTEFLKQMSKSIESYLKVGENKMEIEIPLSFKFESTQ